MVDFSKLRVPGASDSTSEQAHPGRDGEAEAGVAGEAKVKQASTEASASDGDQAKQPTAPAGGLRLRLPGGVGGAGATSTTPNGGVDGGGSIGGDSTSTYAGKPSVASSPTTSGESATVGDRNRETSSAADNAGSSVGVTSTVDGVDEAQAASGAAVLGSAGVTGDAKVGDTSGGSPAPARPGQFGLRLPKPGVDARAAEVAGDSAVEAAPATKVTDGSAAGVTDGVVERDGSSSGVAVERGSSETGEAGVESSSISSKTSAAAPVGRSAAPLSPLEAPEELVSSAVNPMLEAFGDEDEEYFDELESLEEEELFEEAEAEYEEYAEATNPLLEDNDDELISPAGLAQQLGIRGGLSEFADDDLDEDAGETFTGFDSQLQELLGDDDDESVAPVQAPEKRSPVTASELSKPVTGEEEQSSPMLRKPLPRPGESAPAAERGVGEQPATPKKAPSPAPIWNASTPPRRVELEEAELEAEAGERKEHLRARAQEEAQQKEYSSDFIGSPTKVVRVKDEQPRERKRFEKPKPGGKLSNAELDFYKNLTTVREQYSDGMVMSELVTGKRARKVNEQERKQRRDELERTLDGQNLFRSGASFKLDTKTVDTLMFLALFRYATHSHIARMFGEAPLTTLRRLRKIRAAGLVASKKLYSQHDLWFLTEAGVVVSGYDVRHITEARLTPSMFPHQFTVNHVAANLMGGQLNVLGLGDFPSNRRVDVKGVPRLGEELTSELEILSSFSKIKLFEQSSSFRPKLMGMRDRDFQVWSELENRAETPTPEMSYGNEWMFTLFPPLAVGVAYHVPDLVVKRQRGADGAPKSIAVEIEISNKPTASYEKTLRAYAEDKLIFGQVIWVCKTIGPAKKLEKVGKELGLIQSGRLKIVPIWTNDGVFKGRDLWMI